MPEDRYHQAEESIPVITRRRVGVNGKCQAVSVSDDLAVVLFTSATAPDEIWVAMELSEMPWGFTMTLESAKRLHRALGELLGLVEANMSAS